jgi:hypothetical protein
MFVILLVTLQTSILIDQLSSKLLDPNFYLDTLDSADTYNFITTELPTAFLNDNQYNTPDSVIYKVGLTNKDIITAINIIITPDWLKTTTESSFISIANYITGKEDDFKVQISVDEKVEIAAKEITNILTKSDLYEWALENQIEPNISKLSEQEFPLGIKVDQKDLMLTIKNVISKQWLTGKINIAIEQVTPYIVGKSDSFQITITLDELVDPGIVEIKSLLEKSDAYNIIFEEIAKPSISKSLNDISELPYGIKLSDEEIITAISEAVPETYVQSTTESIIDGISPYLIGKTDTFNIAIDLATIKESAADSIIELAKIQLQSKLKSLPNCTSQDVKILLMQGLSQLPYCYPNDNPALKKQFRLIGDNIVNNVTNQVHPMIISKIPDSINFNQNSLDTVFPDGLNQLDDIRQIVKKGWTFNEKDLETLLQKSVGASIYENFQSARNTMKNGITVTNEDLTKFLMSNCGEECVNSLEKVRKFLSFTNIFKILIYLPPLITAMTLGFMCGRSWLQRLIWGSTAILISSCILYIMWSYGFENFVAPILKSEIDSVASNLGQSNYAATQVAIVNKFSFIAKLGVDEFAISIKNTSRIVVILSFLIMCSCFSTSLVNFVSKKIRPIKESTPKNDVLVKPEEQAAYEEQAAKEKAQFLDSIDRQILEHEVAKEENK